jgi:Bacterial Ig-like domain (group 2)
MNRQWLRLTIIVATTLCVLDLPSCGNEQELVSITIQPVTETFGSTTTSLLQDTLLSVQLKALGSYSHPPVTKDITDQVTWASDTVKMVTVSSTGVITPAGEACGSTLITATVTTNKSVGGISSSGAQVIGTMTANVICPSP